MDLAQTQQPSDAALLARIQRNDVQAFDALFCRYRVLAYSLAHRICGAALAEDAMSAAFLSIWNSRETFRPDRGTARSWILAVVRHRAIDIVRREGVRDRHVSRVPEAVNMLRDETAIGQSPQQMLEDSEQATAVRGALAVLPVPQREVIELAFFGGFSHAEIASKLRLPPGTVKGRMRLGLEHLHSALDRTITPQTSSAPDPARSKPPASHARHRRPSPGGPPT